MKQQSSSTESKPCLAVQADNLPEWMREASRWLVWKSVPKKGKKPRKVPYYVNGDLRKGELDSPNDIAQLGTFEEAMATLMTGKYTGIGFALGKDGEGYWQGIDFDDLSAHTKNQGTLFEIELGDNPYIEVSPNGDGKHVLGYGKPFQSFDSKSAQGIEAYAGGRFFTVTGQEGSPEASLVDLAAHAEALRPTPASNTATGHDDLSRDFALGSVTAETVADLRSALPFLKGHSDYDHDWVQVGYAFKALAQAGFEDDALAMWHEFSAMSDKYERSEADKKWAALKPDHAVPQKLFKLAQDAGWVNPKSGQPVPVTPQPFTKVANPFTDWAVPSFPLHTVPEAIANYAKAEAALSGFDVGGYALGTVIALASLIDQRTRLSVNNSYSQPPILWFGLVSESGEGKSPVINAAMRFPKAIDKRLMQKSLEAREHWEAIKALSENNDKKIPAPKWEQLLVNDSTVEALVRVLNSNPHGITLHSDELTRWIGQFDAYGGRNADKDRGNYLEIYEGGTRVINRVGDGVLFVPNWSMSIIGGIQPERLAGMFKKGGSVSSDGLYQRFIVYCLQPSGKLNVMAEAPADNGAEVQTLADTIYGWSEGGTFKDQPPYLSFEAMKAFEDYANAFRTIQKTTPEARFSEHLGKFAGFALRLSYALHSIERAVIGQWEPEVSVETFNRVREILNCLFRHSEAAYSKLNESVKSEELMLDMATTILAKGWQEFTSSDLTRHCNPWRMHTDERERDSSVGKLIDLGWLRDVTLSSGKSTGRKAVGKYQVNPEVHERFVDVATQGVIRRASHFEAIKAAGIERKENVEK